MKHIIGTWIVKGANVRVKIKNLKNNKILNVNFGAKDRFEEVWLDKEILIFLKSAGENLVFKNPDGDQAINISAKTIGEKKRFLVPQQKKRDKKHPIKSVLREKLH